MSIFTVDREKCNSCGMCVAECPTLVFRIEKDGDVPTPVPGGEARCINCGHCVAICPTAAFSLKKMTPAKCLPISKALLPSAAQAELFLRSRRSIRVYRDKPVPHRLLAKLIDIARYAPSASNGQPVQWMVIEDTAELRRIAVMVSDWMQQMLSKMPRGVDSTTMDSLVQRQKMGQDTVTRGAPHLVLAHAPKTIVSAAQDCTLGLAYLELAAYALGLGACWAGYFQMAANYDKAVMEALQLPEEHRCQGAMMIGYPKYRFPRIPLRNRASVTWL